MSVASPPNQEVSRRGVAGAQQGFARLAAITDDLNPNPNLTLTLTLTLTLG